MSPLQHAMPAHGVPIGCINVLISRRFLLGNTNVTDVATCEQCFRE
jgi:hypothetical protein